MSPARCVRFHSTTSGISSATQTFTFGPATSSTLFKVKPSPSPPMSTCAFESPETSGTASCPSCCSDEVAAECISSLLSTRRLNFPSCACSVSRLPSGVMASASLRCGFMPSQASHQSRYARKVRTLPDPFTTDFTDGTDGTGTWPHKAQETHKDAVLAQEDAERTEVLASALCSLRFLL